MAVRLSVIMVHTAPRTATAERMSEAVVGELIGLSGIDLTLVGPLDQIQASSTDQLTLDSLTGDVAVLDWFSPEETVARLSGIGFEGHRAPHKHDADAAQPTEKQRRIYAFDLGQFSEPSAAIEALSQLKESRQVRTFSLGLSAPASSARPTPASPRPAVPSAPADATPPRPTTVGPKQTSPSGGSSPDELDLDDLLDQLDQLDP